jgi:hypothetical protein
MTESNKRLLSDNAKTKAKKRLLPEESDSEPDFDTSDKNSEVVTKKPKKTVVRRQNKPKPRVPRSKSARKSQRPKHPNQPLLSTSNPAALAPSSQSVPHSTLLNTPTQGTEFGLTTNPVELPLLRNSRLVNFPNEVADWLKSFPKEALSTLTPTKKALLKVLLLGCGDCGQMVLSPARATTARRTAEIRVQENFVTFLLHYERFPAVFADWFSSFPDEAFPQLGMLDLKAFEVLMSEMAEVL